MTDDGSEKCVGVEHHLVGLNPGYWAHVPLMVGQVHDLELVDGINCLVVNDDHMIPVSRCHLVGVIVAIDRRSNGSLMFVLDDGTGLVDVLTWESQELYQLPSLTTLSPSEDPTLQIGTVVSIHGRIECVAVGEKSFQREGSRRCDFRSTIREIHSSRLVPLPATRQKPNSLDTETEHWRRCLEFLDQPNLHAKQVLEAVGPEIRDQVARRENFPAAEDKIGEWRVFGVSCKCTASYKYPLLYCHCQATREHLDPDLAFRDALLERLLELERQSDDDKEPLRFLYHTISIDAFLLDVAAKTVTDKSDVTRIFLNTFKALREDGILYLLDFESDTYVLLSRSRILEPYTRKLQATDIEGAVEKMNLLKYRPAYLDKIPKRRLQYLRRLLNEKSV